MLNFESGGGLGGLRCRPPSSIEASDWLKRFPVEFELANQRALFDELKERTFLLLTPPD